jgi:hypothetical protein
VATQNLYVREQDQSAWDDAETAAARLKISLSALVAAAIRDYLKALEEAGTADV